MAWLILILAGLLEVVWATALKQSSGFSRLTPSLIAGSVAIVSLLLLAKALNTLPVGTAYAVWVGIGAFGVAIVGSIYFNEPMSVIRAVFLLCIVAGVAGLHFTTH